MHGDGSNHAETDDPGRDRRLFIHPLMCIIPPHMLDSILARGAEQQKRWARALLEHSTQVRIQRVATFQSFLAEQAAVAISQKGKRTVYDANGGTALPGTLKRSEGQGPTGRDDVDEAYDGAGATYKLYNDIFKRDSIDGRGMPLVSSVNYSKKFDNAFWNGKQMVYGEGDGELFNRFTIAVDVIGHELTHGVTQSTAGLDYTSQSGALNESMSDVFGSLVKQYQKGQSADTADWLIGVGLFTPKVKGRALRSMSNPGTAYDDPVLGKDPQPADMSHYVNTPADNGGVHINSGIPNRAFYLAATAVGGNAWGAAGQIWYETLTKHLQHNANFRQAAQATIAVAKTHGAAIVDKVTQAWRTVKVI